MHYIARDQNGALLDHTMSDNKLTSLLAAFQYQMEVAYQVARQRGDNNPTALDYPLVSVMVVSDGQYERAQAKDLEHFNRLLVQN